MPNGSWPGRDGGTPILPDLPTIYPEVRAGGLLAGQADRIASRVEEAFRGERETNAGPQEISCVVSPVYVHIAARIAPDHSVGRTARGRSGHDVARPALL